VFGRDRVTTGAASDIQQATGLARRYVSQWGLSDEIGPILVGDNEQELFLGREIQTRREVSERTAQLVDSEVSRVIKEAYARAEADGVSASDDAGLVERLGHDVHVVLGSDRNIKITKPADMDLARFYLERERSAK